MYKGSAVSRQFIAIVCCNIYATLSYGLSDGWGQINFLELQNENTTFAPGPLTSEEAALVISIANIGGFIGNFAVVPISRLIGTKRSIHLFGVPLIISSLLIIWAKNVHYLYLSRFLSGLAGGGTSVAIPTLVNFVSFDHVRGALSAIWDPAYNIGIILSYLIGNYLDCVDQAKVQVIIPAIFMIIMCIIPESPEFWQKKNVQKRAIKSHKFYNGKVKFEPEKAEFLPESPNDPITNNQEKPHTNDDNCKKSICKRMSSTLKKFQNRHARRAFFITFTGMILSFFSGIWIVLTYITDVFNKTGSSLSEKNSSLLVSIAPLFTNLIFINIVERFNRKTLYIGSAILTSLGFFSMGVYCVLWLKQPEYQWMPPFLFTCIILSNGMGLSPIPYILIIEIFPKDIRELSLAILISMIWFILFVLGYIFPPMLENFGVASCMIGFGVICLLNALFGLIFVPETRGKSYEEITEMMSK